MSSEELHQLSYLLNKFLKENHPTPDSKLFPNFVDMKKNKEREQIIMTRFMVAEEQLNRVNESEIEIH